MLASSFSSLSLVGKVAVVTGATSGIGAKTAELLAARGAKVIVAGRRQKEGDQVVTTIKAAGGEATFVQCDVAKEDDVKRLIASAVQHYGRLDIAFNNAGVHALNEARTVENADFDLQFDINVRGLHWCLKYEIDQFIRQREESGLKGETSFNGAELVNPNRLFETSHPYSIINNASVLGMKGTRGAYAYCATKHAAIGLTKSAALKYSTYGIRVNAVSPGWTHSEITADMPVKRMVESVPMQRIGQGQEIAEVVAFLASNAASYVTGVSLPVDGGITA